MFYSWPSKAGFSDYFKDGSNSEQAIAYLKNFLKDIAINSDFDSVYLIAHSMGNRVLTNAFLGMKNELPKNKIKMFKEIILAAPDIDAEYFKNSIAPALISSSKVTLYASSNDIALKASKKANGYARAGDSGEGLIVLGGMETIDATNVDTGLFSLGHTYVADRRNVLSDLHSLIMNGKHAQERGGLIKLFKDSKQYWQFIE